MSTPNLPLPPILTKRTSSSSATAFSTAAATASKPPCQIHPSALIADKALLTGSFPIEIRAHAVIHPYAKIRAEGGRVVIGEGCTVSEGAVVGLPEQAQKDDAGEEEGENENEVVLGAGVNIDSNAEVLAKHVGEGSQVGVGVKIGRGARLGKFCTISALNSVPPNSQLPDFTVVYGPNQRRLDTSLAQHDDVRKARMRGQELHVEVLRKLIPNGAAKWI